MTFDMKRLNVVLSIVASVVMIGVSITLLLASFREPGTIFGRPGEPAPPTEPISLEGAATRGSIDAPLAVIEFVDLRCPFCRQFSRDAFAMLDERYLSTGQALFAIRHLPLTAIHPEAETAAIATECAHRQDRAWPMFDRLLATTGPVEAVSVMDLAISLGLDLPQFAACQTTGGPTAVGRDVALAESLGIATTPTFLIGIRDEHGDVIVDRQIEGLISPAELARILETLRETLD